MASPRLPPPLVDDVTAEIFLHLPPDEPEHLFRAALVCKPWLRIICDPGFLRRYRAFHGAPPLLGLLHRLQVHERSLPLRFASTTSVPEFPHPGSEAAYFEVLDCHHGRVLTLDAGRLHVWDPVTADRHAMRAPPDTQWRIECAAVLCSTHGCNHLDCRGGSFRVVFVATHDHKPTISASVYSSETGAWSQPIYLDSSCEYYDQHMQDGITVRPYYLPNLHPRRGTHIGDAIYNTIKLDNTIVKYDWCKNRFSLIPPPSKDVSYIALMAMDNRTLGFACILGSSLRMWSMEMDTEEAAEWLQYRVIELENIVPVANPNGKTVVVGSAEGLGVIFVSTGVGLFSLELKSERVKKIDEPGVYFSVLPYMSFYTPDRGRLLLLARAIDH